MAHSKTTDGVTPAMVEAGAMALHKFDTEDFHRNREALVEAVYRAMREAAKS